MGEIFQFVSYNCYRVFRSSRTYIALLVVFLGMELCFGGVRASLAENGQTIQIFELFIFALTNRLQQWIIVFGLMLLVCDAPFFQPGLELYITRSSRGRWLIGQVLFYLVLALGYLITIFSMMLLLLHGQVNLTNKWSDIIVLSCQTQSGALLNTQTIMNFPMNIIMSGLPYAMFGLTCIYSILLLFLLCMICMMCNIYFRIGFGCFAMVALLVWRLILETAGGPKFLHYISPCNLASIGDKAINLPNILYTLAFFICMCAILCLYCYHIIQRMDLQRNVKL